MHDDGHKGAAGHNDPHDETNGRDARGRFAPGNAGGPGRPRRAVEADYLRTLATACPPERWAKIVARAVADAEAGDAPARAWLSKHLLGADPPSLLRIAAEESLGVDVVDRAAASIERDRRLVDALNGGPTEHRFVIPPPRVLGEGG